MHVKHKWTKWETGEEKRFNYDGDVLKVRYWQKRECEKCGKLVIRRVSTHG